MLQNLVGTVYLDEGDMLQNLVGTVYLETGGAGPEPPSEFEPHRMFLT